MKKLEFINTYKSIVYLKYQSEATRSVYMGRMYAYLDHCRDIVGRTPSHVSTTQIREYLTDMSDSYYNQSLAALHIIYDQILRQTRKLSGLSYRKTKKNVWQVLSKSEVAQMIRDTDNIKHRTIISCLYLLGARTSELLSLRLSDIDRSSMSIHIRGGKGNKDRRIDITADLLALLEEYYRSERPRVYLFEGVGGSQYSASSVSAIVKRHEQSIGKKIWPHLLRHSIATHMINDGVNILEIQRYLGHNSIKSTERYYQYLQSRGVISLSYQLFHTKELYTATS